ncbi:hypothetical protein [Archangium primigenium]|uniref:hypothetical protein n=1 Tax=[Archangium] primigenium TaxID=2792470 RepID=UPI0019593580|nr:hypothetical protein [Archangium primigenium]MBM7116952.1 hypothetical protein [Archangium primigenium]
MSPGPVEHAAYLALLHRLEAEGVAFALTGSLALRLYMDALEGEPVPDCDLFLEPSPDNLQRWARLMAAEGWALAVWDVPVTPPLALEALRGRYYVRARQGALVVDGTYEHDTLNLAEAVAQARRVAGLPLLAWETLLGLKRERGSARDLLHLAQVERWRRGPSRG